MEERATENQRNITECTREAPNSTYTGELKFSRVESEDGALNPIIFKPVPILQRIKNTKFIIIEGLFEHQIYKIEDQTIKFVSSHKVQVPVKTQDYFRTITENRIQYFFTKTAIEVEPRKNHQQFFEERKIDRATPSNLIFELEYGVGKPGVIEAEYVGEMRENFGGFEEWEFKDMFDNQNNLFNRRLSLYRAVKEAEGDDRYLLSLNDREALFLGEFGKEYPNLVKRVFKLNLDPKKLEGYQTKLEEDRNKLPLEIYAGIGDLNFYNSAGKFYLENWEPGRTEKLKQFVKVNRQMIIVGLIDFRKKIVPIKGLISLYEIFSSLEVDKSVEATFCNMINREYSMELDMLILDAWFNFRYFVEDVTHLTSAFDSGLVSGAGKMRKLSLMSARRYGDNPHLVFEVRKIRFKIWNVLNGKERKIEAESLCYTVNSSFKQGQGMLTIFEEDQSEIRLEVLSKRLEDEIEDLEEKDEDPLKEEKKLAGKAQPQEGRVKSYKVAISKEELMKVNGINAYGVKNAFMFDQDNLLITCATKMLLYDLKSSNLLSSCDYSNNVPFQISDLLLDENIMLAGHNQQGYIEVFRIAMEENQPKFCNLGILNLKSLDSRFHCIKQLIGFKKIKERTYELKSIFKWMKSEQSELTSNVLYSLRFELPGQNQEKVQPPRILAGSVEHQFRDQRNEGKCRGYLKNKKWNIIFTERSSSFCIQTGLEDQSTQIFKHLNTLIDSAHLIDNLHLKDNTVYINFFGTDDRLLVAIEFRGRVDEGMMIEPEVQKLIEFPQSAEIYFDEVTEDFRIFVVKRPEDDKGVALKVLDEDLEVVKTIIIDDYVEINQLTVINEKFLHLICSEYRNDFGLTEDFDRKHSLILNLDELTHKKLVVEGEGPLFAFPHDLGGGNLLAFTRDYDAFIQQSSDGIYVSKIDF